MKEIWVKAIPWRKEIASAAVESGADALWIPAGMGSEVKKMGIIATVAEDGDLMLGRDVVEKEIREKKDEEEILALSLSKKVVVKDGDWKIIPLENLLSRTNNLFVEIEDLQEGRTAFGILEKGVDGIVINQSNPEAVRHIVYSLKRETEKIELSLARIKRINPLGLGDRVCVDTCSSMTTGEGMLVGNSSQALFLVHSESVENPFVNPRPFRVNAGPVHAYIRLAGGQTKYLSEVRSGDQVLIVNFEGKNYPALVGRAKVERRPLVLLEAEEDGQGISVILQNAETIRLTQSNGKAVSLVDLKEGNEILVYREGAGRHSGIRIDETIIER
ncbi:MAG: 3-dehydroquinate synthase II [Deltaproteobacteria bacterium]|nr:3-dehydroquinate synthase II [Deltaproteobacteria bacterium]MBM4323738.1 3-dehydroquinate synthase II [Deltaproteobacteria bacterium]